jgi:hypothetical protein
LSFVVSVLDDEELLLEGAPVDGVMLELLELDDGVLAVPLDELVELDVSVDGVVVDGAIVLLELLLVDGVVLGVVVVVVVELELDAGGVPDGTGTVVDDVLLVSFWQPAAAMAAAMARTAQGFGFI